MFPFLCYCIIWSEFLAGPKGRRVKCWNVVFFFLLETLQRLNYQHHAAENQKAEQEFLRVSGTEQATTSKCQAGVEVGEVGLKKTPWPGVRWRLFCFHQRRIRLWRALWTRPGRTRRGSRGGAEQTVITYASVFDGWLLLPQNKYVLKGRAFADITSSIRRLLLKRVKNSLVPLPPRRRTSSALRNDAFLKQDITAHVLVPKTFPKQEKICWISCKGQKMICSTWVFAHMMCYL